MTGDVRFELRPPRFVSPQLFRLLIALALLLGLGVALGLPRGFALYLWGALTLAALGLRAALRSRAGTSIELRDEGLVLSRTLLSRRSVPIRYPDLYEARLGGPRGQRRVVLGVRGRLLPIAFAIADLEQPSDGARIVEELRARVARLSDGAERLGAMDRRADVARVFRRRPWLTLAWAALLVAVFAAQVATGTGAAELDLVRMGANVSGLVSGGELFRLATANLLHAGFGHLALNVLTLLILGSLVEPVFGRARFSLVILAAALGGALASHLADVFAPRAPISVGFSTAVFGLLGALAYLNVQRRNELTVALRVPAWLGLSMVVLEVLFELSVANIDRAAHLGGLATGWLAAALGAAGQPLVGLPQRRSAPVAVALGLVGALFAAATLQGVAQVVGGSRESELRFAERYLGEAERSPLQVNNVAFLFATQPEIGRERLELALEAMEEAIVEAPQFDALWDTLATLYFRLGEVDRAVEAESNALALAYALPSRNGLYASQLARFEAVRYERQGLLRLGHGPDAAPRLRFERVPDDAAEPELRVELAGALPRGGIVHALLLSGERPIAFLELRVGADPLPSYRIAAPGLARLEWADDTRIEVVLVDRRSSGLEGGGLRLAFWPVDPAVVALPGVLPELGLD